MNMMVSRQMLCMAAVLCASTAWGQTNQQEPHIGYLYPAGGRQGTVVRMTVGGQYLRGTTDIYVSGDGVRAKVIQHYRPIRNMKKEQRDELLQRLDEAKKKQLAASSRAGKIAVPRREETDAKQTTGPQRRRAPVARGKVPGRRGGNGPAARKGADQPRTKTAAGEAKVSGLKARDRSARKSDAETPQDKAKTATFTPVQHPLLYDLENKTLRELQHVGYQLFFPRQKKQSNAQIDESVLIEVTIDSDAPPGDRELRLKSPFGLTNPMVFQVGLLPEVCELEPNDPKRYASSTREQPADLPALWNGQIMPGDVDRFRFQAQQGQQLVIETQARHLVPYLADAVPGWFQATLTLYDAEGREVAFGDDYRFDPDPVLCYRIPDTGEYELEIRDSIYRGREDFVYRIAVSERPFITAMFPLGARAGARTSAMVEGWNLPQNRLPLDARTGAESVRQTALQRNRIRSNDVAYQVTNLSEINETEPNDTVQKAQRVDLQHVINGRIAQPGDVDVFQFEGRSGDDVVAEVYARRLHSPLDSCLRLTDASGTIIEWNDDCEDKETGLLTHHADSYLRARIPREGIYYLHLSDAQQHGGDAYGYRLRVGPPQPDFALRVTPASINVSAGCNVPMHVHALRKDGFDGDIELVLTDAPPGFAINGARIPRGRDQIRVTLAAPRFPIDGAVVLRMEGRAVMDGQTVSRPAIPAEDMMQAFLYRHLVPCQELMVAVTGRRSGPPVDLVGDEPVRVPSGASAQVRVRTMKGPAWADIELQLREPPAGLTLQDVTAEPQGLTFMLKADPDNIPVGFADNLIVEAFAEVTGQRAKGSSATRKRRVSLGVLPAIPFEIVSR